MLWLYIVYSEWYDCIFLADLWQKNDINMSWIHDTQNKSAVFSSWHLERSTSGDSKVTGKDIRDEGPQRRADIPPSRVMGPALSIIIINCPHRPLGEPRHLHMYRLRVLMPHGYVVVCFVVDTLERKCNLRKLLALSSSEVVILTTSTLTSHQNVVKMIF